MQLRSTGFNSLFSPNLGNVYNCKKINKHNKPDRVFSLKHDCIHVILSPQSFSWEFGIASIRFPRNQCFYFRLVFSISILHHFATISCVCFKFCWYPRIFGIFFSIELSLAFVFNCHRRYHSKAARRHVLDVTLRSLETSFGHSNVSNLNAVTFAFK